MGREVHCPWKIFSLNPMFRASVSHFVVNRPIAYKMLGIRVAPIADSHRIWRCPGIFVDHQDLFRNLDGNTWDDAAMTGKTGNPAGQAASMGFRTHSPALLFVRSVFICFATRLQDGLDVRSPHVAARTAIIGNIGVVFLEGTGRGGSRAENHRPIWSRRAAAGEIWESEGF